MVVALRSTVIARVP